ncbi:putative nitrogen assimilation transcription factor nira [Phaeomoniella chlamydospora]|uniref:Putative nitrogen assimilation transcription factor nira n=1 Tax=Phaeomoniella chlamydospora TaxID=158046 RepID=A0A0G2GWV7_PHACM|nr:putative nitrogen assimilation transcription factor nira [Phaeomoniella chlamydospora]
MSSPKVLARACLTCRGRKIKCDTAKPTCGPCINNNRPCEYSFEPPKRRPTRAVINTLQSQKRALDQVIIELKKASPEGREIILQSIAVGDASVKLPQSTQTVSNGDSQDGLPNISPTPTVEQVHDEDGDGSSSDEDLDPVNFLSVDESGHIGAFGPSSALHDPLQAGGADKAQHGDHFRYQLIANAALQRQQEHLLRRLPEIDGVPTELAMHLLDLHWNRQHHSFLLTYRPAFMRDLLRGGPYCSFFLLNAIFACSSKFSERLELRDDVTDPNSAGRRFFDRCDDLLVRDELLNHSTIPTIIGLLLLGSTWVARNDTSRGWLYTGYALRMVYDLGLHLDCKEVAGNAEDIEIRRRVFWGAFICDKLQSLYLGRPITIQLRDAHVSKDFMDTMEEMELWGPYVDPAVPDVQSSSYAFTPVPCHSVSTFQQLCLLSKIMTKIINRFYVVGAKPDKARSSLQSVDDSLTSWETTSLIIDTLGCLDELAIPNSGVVNPANIIRKLMAANGIAQNSEATVNTQTPSSFDLDAILQMFPDSSIPETQHTSYQQNLESHAPDLLFGFMDSSFPSPQAAFTYQPDHG